MLDQVRKTNETFPPPKIVLHGVHGIGKTTFGSMFDKPILLPTEEGASAVDMSAFPRARSMQDVVNMIEALHGDHDFGTVVLDSVDWLEPLVWDHTCQRLGENSIESFGYGRGYTEADRDWRTVISGLDSLRYKKSMAVVIIAHSEIKKVEPPDSEAYDRYQLRLHKRAYAMWQEWADCVMFANYQINMKSEDQGFNRTRTRATGAGERTLYTAARPAHDAKNRWNLPEVIHIGKDVTWSGFHRALNEATDGRYKLPQIISDQEVVTDGN